MYHTVLTVINDLSEVVQQSVVHSTDLLRAWLLVLQKSVDEDGIAAVHEAFKLGMNYFDTAPSYGELRSEKVRSRQRDIQDNIRYQGGQASSGFSSFVQLRS